MGHLRWAPVQDFGDWLTVPVEPVSPVRVCQMAGCVPTEWPKSQLIHTGEAQPLLEFAAKSAFWGISDAVVKKLCKETWKLTDVSQEIPPGEDLLAAICAEVPCEPLAAADILEAGLIMRTTVTSTNERMILSSEEGQCCIDKEALGDVTNI